MAGRVTGERVSTQSNGFNPTWQRHVAAYALCAQLLPPGRVLDLGCGIGHSFELLSPRETVGLDRNATVLIGQARETRLGDMRALPFEDRSFPLAIAVQSIEHVPDSSIAIEEACRVLEAGGVAIFVTPNRLTFGPPDEVIDPYHYREFSADELFASCEASFSTVELLGIFGSPRYLALVASERQRLDRLLRLDPLRARRLVPRRLRQRIYDLGLRRVRAGVDPAAGAIEPSDFELRETGIDEALDLVAICRR
jgi:SAM-dependent methyltransferase